MRDRVSPHLERNTGDKMVFGVSSGLADYFGIDPVLVRVGFVVTAFLTGGTMVFVYLLLAVIMPEKGDAERRGGYAQTTAEGVSGDSPQGASSPAPRRSAEREAMASRRRQVAGLLLVGIGALVLAINLGAFKWLDFGTFWPLALILAGLFIVVGAFRGSKRV